MGKEFAKEQGNERIEEGFSEQKRKDSNRIPYKCCWNRREGGIGTMPPYYAADIRKRKRTRRLAFILV